MIGVRIPSDLLSKLDALKDEEGIDRTALILRALRYWVLIEGKVTADAEYLHRLAQIDASIAHISSGMEDVKQLKNMVSEQQQVINALVKLIPRGD